jgi:hypothetical protein
MLYVLWKGKHKTSKRALLKPLGKQSLQSYMPIPIIHPHGSISHRVNAISVCIQVWLSFRNAENLTPNGFLYKNSL